MNEVRFYKSIAQGLKLIGLCSLFVLPSVYFIATGADEQWKWWACALFFGLGYVAGLYIILDRRPQLIISEVGIFDRNLGQDVINWEVITGAYLATISKQKFICLIVDEQYEPSRKKGKIYRSFAKLNKELGFQELNISLNNINADGEQLLSFISLLISAEKPDRLKMIDAGMGT